MVLQWFWRCIPEVGAFASSGLSSVGNLRPFLGLRAVLSIFCVIRAVRGAQMGSSFGGHMARSGLHEAMLGTIPTVDDRNFA